MVLGILNTDGLEVIDSGLLMQALIPCADNNVDFIDAFNAAWMLKYRIDRIYTFDHMHFSRFEGIMAKAPQ
jgi:predicted nucleic acid-binding protein